MAKRMNQRHRRDQRREEAEHRQQLREQRTDEQQIARLDEAGHCALRERERLQKRRKK